MTQFDPKLLERGLVCTPGSIPTIVAAIISVHNIPYFKTAISTKAKFHITVGHETVMGKATFFGLHVDSPPYDTAAFDFSREYMYQEELITSKSASQEAVPKYQFAVLELETPVICSATSLVIASKLDTDIHSNVCRIAFHGTMLEAITDPKYASTLLPNIKVYKNKSREGVVERKADDYCVICRNLFKKESNIDTFVGLKVQLSTGEDGIIEGAFGQSGKFKVRIPGLYFTI